MEYPIKIDVHNVVVNMPGQNTPSPIPIENNEENESPASITLSIDDEGNCDFRYNTTNAGILAVLLYDLSKGKLLGEQLTIIKATDYQLFQDIITIMKELEKSNESMEESAVQPIHSLQTNHSQPMQDVEDEE